MLDSKDVASIETLLHYMMIGTKGRDPYHIPDRYINVPGRLLFETIADTIPRGRHFYLGGKLLKYDYCLTWVRGNFYDKKMEELYPALVECDLYILFLHLGKPHVLHYDKDSNSYSLSMIGRKSSLLNTQWTMSFKNPLDMQGPIKMFSKFIATKTTYIKDNEIVHNKALG